MARKSKSSLNPLALQAAFGSLGYDNPVVPVLSNLDKRENATSRPLVLTMMIKNEEKGIENTFNSVKEISQTFVILDTGSTDRTIDICKRYCERHHIKLYLKEEPFVNFCVTRNVLLDFADEVLVDEKTKRPIPHYLLLLDCNDELRNAKELRQFVDTYDGPASGYYLKQQWWSGNSLDTYYNIRLVLSHQKWRYKGVVHEYICQPTTNDNAILKLDNIVLFQDRTKDDDKSHRRFNRDKDLLYTEYLKDPSEPRTVFYLAQTCSCLGQHAESYLYYYERTKLGGFVEEQFHAYYRLGELSHVLGHPWEESLNWLLKAFYHSSRVEPLIRIVEYYRENTPLGEKRPDYMTAYMYASMACKLMYPHQQVLFVDRQAYLYKRWHLMGTVAYYVGRYKEGKEACIRALQAEPENQLDMNNLQFYLKKDKEINNQLLQKRFEFPASLIVCSDNGEHMPSQEEGAGYGTKKTREEVLRSGLEKYLKENK